MNSTEEMRKVPQEWLGVVLWWLRGVRNDTDDVRTPQLRQSIAHGYQLFVGLYSLVVVVATAANVALVITVRRHRLYQDHTYRYLMNLTLSNMAHGCLVVPLTMVVMLLHNWLFGAFLCHLIPIIQEIPLHASTLTHTLVVWDRLRHVRRPSDRRLSAGATSAAAWLLAALVVLPFYGYTTYIDLGVHLQEHFEGVGICVSDLTRGIRIYARALVLVMYVVPVCVMLRLHLSLSAEVHRSLDTLCVEFDAGGSYSPTFHRRGEPERSQVLPLPTSPAPAPVTAPAPNLGTTDGFHVECRLHEWLASMASVHCICLCPLMVLRIAKSGLDENYENSGHFDILFSVFVWLASLPCAISPLIFLFIYSERSAMDHVRKWLRTSRRLFTTGPEDKRRPADTPARGLIQPALSRESREYCTTV